MFPDKSNPINLKKPLEIHLLREFYGFLNLDSNKLYYITDSQGTKVFSCGRQDIINELRNRNLMTISYTIANGHKVNMDVNEIRYNTDYVNLNLKPIDDTCGWVPSITSVKLTLPIGTEFYISYIKLGKTLSANVGTKIKILKCSEKILKNKTLFISNDFLNNFKFSL